MRALTLTVLLFSAGTTHAAEPRIVQCTARQAAPLRAAAELVRQKLTTLVPPANDVAKFDIDYVRKNFIEPKGRVTRWFPEDPARTDRAYTDYINGMKRTITAMARDAEAGYEMRCVTNSDRQCSDGDTLAYVYYIAGVRLPRVYICPLFFQSPPSSQGSTIFHELSHYSADTEHGDFSKPTSLEQLRNNYSDAYHIEPLMYRSLEKHLEFTWAQMWSVPRNPVDTDTLEIPADLEFFFAPDTVQNL